MKAYAGYFKENEKVKKSSSGGAASAVSEAIIKRGGIVYGATYAVDYYSAEYARAEKESDLQRFKGSKYVAVNKYISEDGRQIPVYRDALEKLEQGRTVLFTGLGCDIVALKQLAKSNKTDTKNLYTVELLCDGVTNAKVHEDYVKSIENMHDSKVKSFTVRYKKEGWVPLYIHAEFENGQEHVRPFYNSEYGYAFSNYKRKACYECPIKGEKHAADLMVADYWGCKPGMKMYHKDGVSLLFVQTEKGTELLDMIDADSFCFDEVDAEYALYHSPRYHGCHPKNPRWEEFDRAINDVGLREAVKKCSGVYEPERLADKEINEIIVWGTGDCFRKHISDVRYVYPVRYAVDSDERKWGKEIAPGIVCVSPESLKGKKDILVLVMVENAGAAFQIANQLIDMGITDFDHIHNWRCYVRYDETKQEVSDVFPREILIPSSRTITREERHLYQYPVMVEYLKKKIKGRGFADFFDEKKEGIALYAVSDFTDLICDDVLQCGKEKLICYICDKNADGYKKGRKGYAVVTPDTLVHDYRDRKVTQIVVCSLVHENAIFKELISRGIREEDLISVASVVYD